MTIGNEDWGVFLSPDDFGHVAFWETCEGEYAEMPGIFERSREVVLPGETGGISAMMPVFTTAESSIPETASQGDDVEIAERSYRVADIQPSGDGLARVILEKV